MFELPAEYLKIQKAARELAANVESIAQEADEHTAIHPRVRSLLADSGLTQHVVTREFGGMHDELDPVAIAVIREALMYSSAHMDSLFGMQGVGSYALSVGGTDSIKRTWLPRVASVDAIAALALTEPEVGSDLRAVSTTINEEHGHLVINGRKSFITNGGAADFYCVLGREDEGYSMVFVPSSATGLEVRQGANLIAPHILGELSFTNVKVPPEYRLGPVGKAFSLMLQTLAVYRVTVAASGVGLAQAGLDEALTHCKSRTQFGRPLAELGAVSQKLASSWTEIEAARSLVYRAAFRAQKDPLANIDFSSMAKVQATETAGRVVDSAVQMMGRFGLVSGNKIERLYRNARPLRVYEGATEVLLDSLSRRLLKKDN